jgi:hypothetical protein
MTCDFSAASDLGIIFRLGLDPGDELVELGPERVFSMKSMTRPNVKRVAGVIFGACSVEHK